MFERLKRLLGFGNKSKAEKNLKVKDNIKIEANPSDEPKKEKSQQEVEKVAEKPRLGYFHLSGCTGDIMSLSENYDILAEILTNMVDVVYGQTLVDVWWDDENPMPEMDLALVEGSVCLQDEHSLKELYELRKKAKLVCALDLVLKTVVLQGSVEVDSKLNLNMSLLYQSQI